jgi:hypothetical protein
MPYKPHNNDFFCFIGKFTDIWHISVNLPIFWSVVCLIKAENLKGNSSYLRRRRFIIVENNPYPLLPKHRRCFILCDRIMQPRRGWDDWEN